MTLDTFLTRKGTQAGYLNNVLPLKVVGWVGLGGETQDLSDSPSPNSDFPTL